MARIAEFLPKWRAPEKLTSALGRDAFVEFLATGLFLFVNIAVIASTGALDSTSPSPRLSVPRLLTIATSFGLSIAVLVYAAAPFSGAHLNPAVTAGFLLRGKITAVRAGLYVVAQVVGAIFGTYAAKVVSYGTFDAVDGGANILTPGFDWLHAWWLEMCLTFLLVFVVFVATDQQRASTPHVPILAPFSIGIAVLLAHLVAIPYDGCSINPARSSGSAVVAHQWHHFYVFWIGPMSGALLAAAVYELFLTARAATVTNADGREFARIGTFTGTAGLEEIKRGPVEEI